MSSSMRLRSRNSRAAYTGSVASIVLEKVKTPSNDESGEYPEDTASAGRRVFAIPHLMTTIIQHVNLGSLREFALSNLDCFALAAPRLYHTVRFTLQTAGGDDLATIQSIYPFRLKTMHGNDNAARASYDASHVGRARSIALQCVRHVFLPPHKWNQCLTDHIQPEKTVRIQRLVDCRSDRNKWRSIARACTGAHEFVHIRLRQHVLPINSTCRQTLTYIHEGHEKLRGKLIKIVHVVPDYPNFSMFRPASIPFWPLPLWRLSTKRTNTLENIVIVPPDTRPIDTRSIGLDRADNYRSNVVTHIWECTIKPWISPDRKNLRIIIIEPESDHRDPTDTDANDRSEDRNPAQFRSCKHDLWNCCTKEYRSEAGDARQQALKKWAWLSFMTAEQYRQTSIWEESDMIDAVAPMAAGP